MKSKFIKYQKKCEQIGGVVKTICEKNPTDTICPPPSNYMGLCVENGFDCDQPYDKNLAYVPKLTFGAEDIEFEEKYKIGLRKGYVEGNLTNPCYDIETRNDYINPISNGSI